MPRLLFRCQFLSVAVFMELTKTNMRALSFGVVCKMDLECATIPPGIINKEVKKVYATSVLFLPLTLN